MPQFQAPLNNFSSLKNGKKWEKNREKGYLVVKETGFGVPRSMPGSKLSLLSSADTKCCWTGSNVYIPLPALKRGQLENSSQKKPIPELQLLKQVLSHPYQHSAQLWPHTNLDLERLRGGKSCLNIAKSKLFSQIVPCPDLLSVPEVTDGEYWILFLEFCCTPVTLSSWKGRLEGFKRPVDVELRDVV